MPQIASVGDDIINILSKTGYPIEELSAESFDWISEITDLHDFIDWFTNTITEDNYRSPECHILEKHLKKNKVHIIEEELDEELHSYISNPDLHLCDGNETNLLNAYNSCKQQLDYLSFLQDVIVEEKTYLEEEREIMKVQINKKENISNTEKRVVMELIDQYSHSLGEVEGNWMKLHNNVFDKYVSGSGMYFCQQSLDIYLQLNDSFETVWSSVKRLINKMGIRNKYFRDQISTSGSMMGGFNNSTNFTFSNVENSDYINTNMHRAAFDCQQAEMEYILATSLNAGITEALHFLNVKCEEISEQSNKSNINEISVVVPKFIPPEVCSEYQLLLKSQKYVRSLLVGKGNEEKSRKTQQKRKKLMHLVELEKILKKRKLLNNIFWLFLRREAKIIRAAEFLLLNTREVLNRSVTENQHRMALGHEEKPQSCHTIQMNPMLKTLGLMLSNLPESNNCNSFEDIIETIKRVDMGVIKAQEQIAFNLHEQTEVMRNIFQWLKNFQQYLFVAPTRRLIIFDREMTDSLNIIENRLEKTENYMSCIKNKLNKHKESLKDPYRQKLEYMWIFLFKQPHRLISDISEIEEEAKSMEEENNIRIREQSCTIIKPYWY